MCGVCYGGRNFSLSERVGCPKGWWGMVSNRISLEEHAISKQRSPFQCVCGTKFARVDVLRRHINSYSKDCPKFPCTRCKIHRGELGFRRRDHLLHYHKLDVDEINTITPPLKHTRLFNHPVCPHNWCELFRDGSFQALSWTKQVKQRPFGKRSARRDPLPM
jgi:hypothetical protein